MTTKKECLYKRKELTLTKKCLGFVFAFASLMLKPASCGGTGGATTATARQLPVSE